MFVTISLVVRDFLLDAAGAYTLTASASSISVQVPLIDDGVFELSETLTASLDFSSNEAPPHVTISPDAAEITILDDDSMYNYTIPVAQPNEFFLLSVLTIGFDPIEYEFREDSGANPIFVSLLSGNPGEFTVVVLAAGADRDSGIDTATGSKLCITESVTVKE